MHAPIPYGPAYKYALSGGSKGALPARTPYGPKLSQFHAVLGNFGKLMLAPPWRVGAPFYEESWIHPSLYMTYLWQVPPPTILFNFHAVLGGDLAKIIRVLCSCLWSPAPSRSQNYKICCWGVFTKVMNSLFAPYS